MFVLSVINRFFEMSHCDRLINHRWARSYRFRSPKRYLSVGGRAVLFSHFFVFSAFVANVAYADAQAAFGDQAALSASGYRLAPQDKLKLRFLEWQPASGEFNEWTALNDEYTVDASGYVIVPLIGRVRARGLTTTRLASIISERMKGRVGLTSAPDVSIEVATYRPVFVVGDVQERGEFPYRPGLTTMKALAVAGGVFRDATRGTTIRREKIAAESSLKQAQLQLRRMLIRRSRLNSEIEFVEAEEFDRVGFARPQELQHIKSVAKLLLDEERIMKARMSGYKSKNTALKALKELLEKESAALEEKTQSMAKQVRMANEQSAKIENLWKKKLVVSTVRMESQRALAELEGSMLDLETASLRVKLELSKAQRELEDARSELMAEATTELQEVESKVDLLRYKVATEQALVRVSLEMMPPSVQLNEVNGLERVLFTIKRSLGDDTKPVSIVADADTPVLPGDVVHVSVKPAKGDELNNSFVGASQGHPLDRSGEMATNDQDL